MAHKSSETKFFPLMQNFLKIRMKELKRDLCDKYLPSALIYPTCGSKCLFRPSNKTISAEAGITMTGGARYVRFIVMCFRTILVVRH